VFQAHAEIYFTFCDTAARDILAKFSAIQKLSRNGLLESAERRLGTAL